MQPDQVSSSDSLLLLLCLYSITCWDEHNRILSPGISLNCIDRQLVTMETKVYKHAVWL